VAEGSAIELDPVRLRGLAHPLRVRLLSLLREDGPSTATRLANQLGLSSGATSYHLRQLAAYGFVELDADRGVGRERWWRARHATTMLTPQAGRAAIREAEGYLRAVTIADFQRVHTFLAEVPTMSRQWDDAWTISAAQLRLTTGQAVDLRLRIEALVGEFLAEHTVADSTAEGARVMVQWQVFPVLTEAEGG
jgi:predicted ArsR family transcriptional regulator